MLTITKSTYPLFLYVFPHHYEYMRGLAIPGAEGANLGDSTGPDSCDFGGYGSYLAKNHVERWRNSPYGHDRDSNLISPA